MRVLNAVAIGIDMSDKPTIVIVDISGRYNASRVLYICQAMRGIVMIPGGITLLVSDSDKVASEIILINDRPAIGIGNLCNASMGIPGENNALPRGMDNAI